MLYDLSTMSLMSVAQSPVFLSLSMSAISVVSGIPQSSSRVLRDTCDCPEDCDDEHDHPGCDGKPNGSCRPGQCKADPETMASTDEHASMEDLEESVHSLRVMVAALLALVLILLLAVVLIFLKLYLPSFFKSFKKRSDPERRPSTTQKLRQRPSSTQNLRELSVSTIRLANHQQSDESPRPASRLSRNIPHSTPVSEENKQQAAPPKKLTRQPSESTCPDESSDTHQGYDNLGLSTSTLHNQSTSSSNRSLGGVNNSTRTLNTILPSENSPHETLSTRI